MNKGMFSSNTCEWETPLPFFQQLDAVHHFTLDVCATPENAKCAEYFTKDQDGLAQEWHGNCWMNPPYGREIGAWMRKAYESVAVGGAIFAVVLSPRGLILHGGMITP